MSKALISAQKIADLEKLIGHEFKTHERLVRALTHTSAKIGKQGISHYERLEFLGDRVLGLCVADMLFAQYPDAREGELSVRLNAMVSGRTCAEIADEIGLSDYIHAGSDKLHIASKRMQSVRADVVESLIAAIFLDGGLAAAQKFVKRYWSERLEDAGAGISDSKTALQEWAHIAYGTTPSYQIVERKGPDHKPSFVVAVTIEGGQGAQGQGGSKRAAEQAAAKAVLLREKVWLQNANGQIRVKSK